MTDMSDVAVPPETFVHRLRRSREFAHLAQDEMASRLGVTRKTVSSWERGGPMKKVYVETWARHCGVPLGWLLTGDSDDSGSSWPGAEVLQLAV